MNKVEISLKNADSHIPFSPKKLGKKDKNKLLNKSPLGKVIRAE